jgi:hypothetical protein
VLVSAAARRRAGGLLTLASFLWGVQTEFKTVRNQIIQCIIQTDMTYHGPKMKKLEAIADFSTGAPHGLLALPCTPPPPRRPAPGHCPAPGQHPGGRFHSVIS